MPFCRLMLLACCVLPCPAVLARDIFVSNIAGDDRSSGDVADTSAPGRGPVRTIAKALRLAQPGDHVVLAAMGPPYRESVGISGLRMSGVDGDLPLVIVGNGAVLDGSVPVPDGAWEFYLDDTFRFRPVRLAHQQLFIEDRPAVRRPATSLDFKVPKLEPREWCLTGGYIYFCVEPGKLPQDYRPTYAALPTGITLYKVHDVEIGDLTVQGYQLDGINAVDGAFDVLLSGVTCRGNGRSGLSVGGSSRVFVTGGVLGDNGSFVPTAHRGLFAHDRRGNPTDSEHGSGHFAAGGRTNDRGPRGRRGRESAGPLAGKIIVRRLLESRNRR
jgi:hypothetical protein